MSASQLRKHITLGVAEALKQNQQNPNSTTSVSNELHSEGRKATVMFINGSFRGVNEDFRFPDITVKNLCLCRLFGKDDRIPPLRALHSKDFKDKNKAFL